MFYCFRNFNILNFSLEIFFKGPPEAVRNILSIFLFFNFCKVYQIEKCSESTGINFVLNFLRSFLLRFHPQMIASLFAIAIFFVYLIILIVGSSPCIPDIRTHSIVYFTFKISMK